MSVISRLFGRRSTIPEILCDTEDGFADLTFSIVGRSKHPNGTWNFHVRARHAKQVVGFEVVLGEEWKPWEIELGDGSTLPAFNGVVELRSTGIESDQFGALLGELYGVSGPSKMQPVIGFAATSLGADPQQLETQDLKIKLFYEPDERDGYAEVFLNVSYVPGLVQLREKDEEYRRPLVSAIAGAA